MKKLVLMLVSLIVINAQANDGLFWSARTNEQGVLVYRGSVSTPGAARCAGMPARYLKMVNGAVVEMTAEEKHMVDLPAKYKNPDGTEMSDEQKRLVDLPAKYKNPDGSEMTDEQKAAVDAAEEAARQAAKSAALKNAENNFLSLCDLLTSSTNHTKLGFAELNEIIALLPQEQQVIIGIKLLAVDAEAKREGGLKWWDDCKWHPVTLGMTLGATAKTATVVKNIVKASPVVAGSYMTSGLTGLFGGLVALVFGYVFTRKSKK